MNQGPEEVAPSPGGESVISSKRGASPDEGVDPTSTGAGGRKKKKAILPGSRGVANLTPEQLAKKRQNGTEQKPFSCSNIAPYLDQIRP
jgi:hypothetical protein